MDGIYDKKFQDAEKKFDTYGRLGVTADDHRALGSTPPEILKENPGKTKLDLMSNEDVKEFLRERKKEIEKYSSFEYINNEFAKSYLRSILEDTKITIEFLRSKFRLPDEFADWELTTMEYDPETIEKGCAEVRDWLKTSEGDALVNGIVDDLMSEDEKEFERQVQAMPQPLRVLVNCIGWIYIKIDLIISKLKRT